MHGFELSYKVGFCFCAPMHLLLNNLFLLPPPPLRIPYSSTGHRSLRRVSPAFVTPKRSESLCLSLAVVAAAAAAVVEVAAAVVVVVVVVAVGGLPWVFATTPPPPS